MQLPPRHRTTSAAGRALVGLVVLLLLVLPATAAVAGPWFHEPFDNGETDVFNGWGWKGSGSGHVGAGLFTRMATGSHYGAASQVELSDLGKHGTDEVYWRYWLRLDHDFHIASTGSGDRGKLPGPAGLYSYNCRGSRPSTTSGPCWSARTMFSRPQYADSTPHDQTLLGSYVYHLDQLFDRGDILVWDRPAGLVSHGRWHCVEGRVRMNALGKADGVLQNWVDGRLAFDRRDFRFRRDGESQLHVKSFWMDVYYGGRGTSTTDNDVWVDSLAMSDRRVGCDDRDGYGFTDHAASVHRADIDWFGARGITRGCNPPDNTRYCPASPVSRGQMAVFLSRVLELPAASGNPFRDDDGSTYESAIESLAAAGITKGCNPPDNDLFCPDDPVTRGEMAAFLTRGWRLPPGSSSFTDIAGSPFVKDIGAIARVGVTKGCNPPDNDRYCPRDAVTRGQMASFVRRIAVSVRVS